jgi:UDP-glucose 4-epimerase
MNNLVTGGAGYIGSHTFPDRRNTRVADIGHPLMDAAEANFLHGLAPIESPEQGMHNAIALTVGHDRFKAVGGQHGV